MNGPRIRRPRAWGSAPGHCLLRWAVLGALALPAVAAAPGAAAPPSVWVNPSVHPITVRVDVAVATTLQLEVDRRGVPVHRGAPLSVLPGRVALTWKGAGAASDGRYLVSVRDLTSDLLVTGPVDAKVDLHAPRVSLLVPPIAIPRSPAPTLVVRMADTERTGLWVRWQIATPEGSLRPLGRWRPWSSPADTAPLLSVLRSTHAVGPINVRLEARDQAGNTSASRPGWVDPATAPTPPLVVVRRVVTSKPWVALTFDDGYQPAAIESILSTLDRLHARATFCFNAVNVPRWTTALRLHITRSVAEGRLGICNHGYSHRTSRFSTEAFDLGDIAGNVGWDRIAGVSSIPVYRPPNGDYGPALEAAVHALGYRYLLLWSVDTRDWSGVSSFQISAQVVGTADRGSIVIEHALTNSAAALPAIIAGLRRRGLEPVRIDDLLAAGKPSL